MMEAGPNSWREMHATFNQGNGFAAYVSPSEVHATLAAAQIAGHTAWVAGQVRKEGSRKAVVIPSLGLAYEADTLQVR